MYFNGKCLHDSTKGFLEGHYNIITNHSVMGEGFSSTFYTKIRDHVRVAVCLNPLNKILNIFHFWSYIAQFYMAM